MFNVMDHLARNVGYSSYQDYLRSDHWLYFSRHAKRDKCHCCDVAKAGLQVHHVTYERLGKERFDDVVTVCGKCHVKIHDIVKSGMPLANAHAVLRQRLAARGDNGRNWVGWFKLLNKSKRQTPDQLRHFLMSKGLSDGSAATDKAYRLKFVREIDGKERWNLLAYIRLMQADKKVAKLKAQGKSVHPAMLLRAFPD